MTRTGPDVALVPVFDQVRRIVGFGHDVRALDRAHHGYSHGFAIGPVRVYHHPDRPDMGVCVDVSGQACEELGTDGVAKLLALQGYKVTRLDLAIDGAPFTPAQLRDEWLAGNVRTRVKVMRGARDDRQYRTHDWQSNPHGDAFYMGSRSSEQYLRCYDRRGPTRLELELKKDTAQAAAELLRRPLASRAKRSPRRVAQLVLGLVRRFVDFVDRHADTNASRLPLLPWWYAFVRSAKKVDLQRPQRDPRTVAEVVGWVEHQLAPTLSALSRVVGWSAIVDVVRSGRTRWGPRHYELMRGGGGVHVAPA